MAHELDLLELAAAWWSKGRRVAFATVVATWSSSPRPPGSQLLADDSGRFMGSVSGGCIEREVMRRAQEVIETGEMEDILTATRTFYATLTPEQRKTFDDLTPFGERAPKWHHGGQRHPGAQ